MRRRTGYLWSFFSWGLLGVAASGGIASANNYPDKPIQLIVGYGAGGGTDMCFRALAQSASQTLGQSIVIENKPGAGSSLSIAYITRQKPDGYSIAALSTGGVLNQYLIKSTTYDVNKDLTPLSMMAQYQAGLLVRADSPYKTIHDVIEAAKAKSISYSTAGVGTPQHLTMEVLGKQTGAKWVHAPYKSGIEASTALLRGDVEVMSQTAEWAPYVRDKRLRLLTVYTDKRMPEFDYAPTLKEAGFDIVAPSMFGLVGPQGIDAKIVEKLDKAFKTAIDSKEFQNCAQQFGLMVDYKTPQEFAAYIKQTADGWGPVALELNTQ